MDVMLFLSREELEYLTARTIAEIKQMGDSKSSVKAIKLAYKLIECIEKEDERLATLAEKAEQDAIGASQMPM